MSKQTGSASPQGGPVEAGNQPPSTTVTPNPALPAPANGERETSRYSFEGLLLFRP